MSVSTTNILIHFKRVLKHPVIAILKMASERLSKWYFYCTNNASYCFQNRKLFFLQINFKYIRDVHIARILIFGKKILAAALFFGGGGQNIA